MTVSIPRDNNRVTAMAGVLDTDGTTVQVIYADPITHRMKAQDGATGVSVGGNDAKRDDNRVTALLAVSSVDGVTPVPLFVNASHQLLIKST